MRPSSTASATLFESSKQTARPRKLASSMLETLKTIPSGARLPKQIWMSAKALKGASAGAISSWSAGGLGASARFSARVKPVTVSPSPSRTPASSRCFRRTEAPPIRCRSTMVPGPRGAKLQRTGVFRMMGWMSARVKSTFASRASASRWSMPLVEPPMAAIAAAALLKAVLVRMSRGRISFCSRFFTSAPVLPHSSVFPGSMAGIELLWGGESPMASRAIPQVLKEAAMPQPPGPGQATRRISSASSCSIAPTAAAA